MSQRQNRILIVDDDPTFCAMAKAKIARNGSSVVSADTGRSALSIVESDELDLALIDLGLPDVDGFELIGQMREAQKTRNIPLIVVTGRDDSEAIDRAFDLGATSFLTKPINWKLFEYQLAYVLRSASIENASRRAHIRAQAESRIKDQLTSRINHSIQPRVRLLMQAAERLAVLTGRLPQSEAVSNAAEALIQGASHLREDLSGMLFLTRAVSGDLALSEERLKIRTVVGGVVQNYAQTIARQQVQLQVDLPDEEIFVEADWTKLSWALNNLVGNALRHAPAGSCVTIAVDRLDDRTLYISVEDQGPGISPDLLAHLLVPMIDDTHEFKPGTLSGLGLMVTKLIAEGHGGFLSVRSSPGHGTTAGILLPADRVYGGRQTVAAA